MLFSICLCERTKKQSLFALRIKGVHVICFVLNVKKEKPSKRRDNDECFGDAPSSFIPSAFHLPHLVLLHVKKDERGKWGVEKTNPKNTRVGKSQHVHAEKKKEGNEKPFPQTRQTVFFVSLSPVHSAVACLRVKGHPTYFIQA